MINVKDAPVDVEEIRLWALNYRERDGDPISNARFADECGIPQGTLGPWLDRKYTGREDNVARRMLQFKQQIEAGAKHRDALPTDPGFFETETSMQIESLLVMAHSGKITVGGYGPGTGKTITAREYEQKAQPVWLATMKPTTKRVSQMIMEVHKALGLEPRYMIAAEASRIVMDRIRKRKGLLIIDEANHLTIDAIEEIRSWHDETGVGICFLGNQELIRRLRQGKHKEQFARLNSRIQISLVQDVPSAADISAFCDAWSITDGAIRRYLSNIATSHDAGGLRECRQLVEMASAFAAHDERGLMLDDLREVQAGRATKWIRA